MRKYLVYTMLICLIACQDNSEHSLPNVMDSNEVDSVEPSIEIDKVDLNMTQFSEIDSSGILIFPLSLNNGNGKRSSYGKSSKSYNYGYWNIIFYNGHTNKSHLLTENKIYIQDFEIYKTHKRSAIVSKNIDAIFYQGVEKDYNNDKKLDDIDPSYLFISDKEGNNFRRLSPENYDVQSWQYVRSLDKIILLATKDGNGDLKFDENDNVETFIISLESNSSPNMLFDTAFKKELKTLYARDWKTAED